MLALVPENAVRKERELVGLLNMIAEGKGKILPFMAGRKYFNINDIGEYEKAKEEVKKTYEAWMSQGIPGIRE